jgi:hypothetical protein
MAHQPLDPAVPNAATVAAQSGMHPWRTVGAAALAMDLPDILEQRPVITSAQALRP